MKDIILLLKKINSHLLLLDKFPPVFATRIVKADFLSIFPGVIKFMRVTLELVSKELNHFGVIADLFRQIGGHSSGFVLFCSF